MKITVSDAKVNKIEKSFNGLVKDRVGDLWILFKNFSFCILDNNNCLEYFDRTEAEEMYGPFTKYFGTVTLEND